MRRPLTALCALTFACSAPPPPAAKPPPQPAQKPVAAAPAPPATQPLVLQPADGPDLVGILVMPAVDRTVQATVALARAVRPLPLDAGGIKAMLTARAGIPDELASAVDLGKPLSVAFSYDAETGNVLVASAVAHRGKDAFSAALGKLGPAVGRRGEARAYPAPGGQGTLWTLVEGDLAFFANDAVALERAARSAEKAHKAPAPPEDLIATTWPARWKSAAGFDLEANARLVSGQVATAGALIPNGDVLVALAAPLFGGYAARIGESRAITAYARVGEQTGIELGVRLDARPGTSLERIASAAPGPLRAPAMVQEGRPAVFLATSPRTPGEPTPIWDAVLGAFASAPSDRVKAVGGFYKAFFVECDGSMAMAMTSDAKGGMRMNGVFGTKDEAAGARYLALFAKDGGKAMNALMATSMPGQAAPITLKLKTEKVGGRPTVVTTIDAPKDHPMREALLKVYGKLPVQSYMVAKDSHVGVTFGGDAKQRLGKLLQSPPAAPTDALVVHAFSPAAMRAGVVLIDVGAYARWISSSLEAAGGAPGGLRTLAASKEALPIVFDWGTGANARLDGVLRLPISLFRGLARLFGST